MINSDFILITLIALLIDVTIGELPGKHVVQYFGDFIVMYEKRFYKNTVMRGAMLVALLVVGVFGVFLSIDFGLFVLSSKNIFTYGLYVLLIGTIASTGLASKTLKVYIKKVLYADKKEQRKNLSLLVSRNTEVLDDKKVYSSLIETHSENISDGVISPLFYLLLFGLPGIMVFKAVSTMDSMIGYKNEKYIKFGKAAAILDDILNFIPARLTGFLIWILFQNKASLKVIINDAQKYSTSPNAGYPVAAAGHGLGVKLGGTVYYGEQKVDKAEIGEERTQNYKKAVEAFLDIHKRIEIILVLFLSNILFVSYL